MTAKIDLAHEAYLYAQELDNEGGVEYWCTSGLGVIWERLMPSDTRLPDIRDRLDFLQGRGRSWTVGGDALPCGINMNGDCVVCIHPITLDVNERVSPVLLLFNALSSSRQQIASAIEKIPSLMKRDLDDEILLSSSRLRRILGWSCWLILLHMIVFSKRVKND